MRIKYCFMRFTNDCILSHPPTPIYDCISTFFLNGMWSDTGTYLSLLCKVSSLSHTSATHPLFHLNIVAPYNTSSVYLFHYAHTMPHLSWLQTPLLPFLRAVIYTVVFGSIKKQHNFTFWHENLLKEQDSVP